jgi:hypothetical protein
MREIYARGRGHRGSRQRSHETASQQYVKLSDRRGALFPFPITSRSLSGAGQRAALYYLLATTYDYDSLCGTTPIH